MTVLSQLSGSALMEPNKETKTILILSPMTITPSPKCRRQIVGRPQTVCTSQS